MFEAFENAIQLGEVVKPHGVGGALKVRLFNPDSDRLERARPEQLALCSSGALSAQPAAVAGVLPGVHVVGRSGVEFVIVRSQAVTERSQAESLVGARLLLARSAVELAQDEFLYADLIGCSALEKDQSFGVVTDIFSAAGAAPVLVVRQEQVERLIPFVAQWVGAVDLASRTIELLDASVWEPQPIAGESAAISAPTGQRAAPRARRGRSRGPRT